MHQIFLYIHFLDISYLSKRGGFIEIQNLNKAIKENRSELLNVTIVLQDLKKTKILFDPSSFIKIYIDFPREVLVNRIKKRVDQMFNEGAILEVKRFNRLKVKKDNSSRKVIGIEEIGKLIDREINLIEAK